VSDQVQGMGYFESEVETDTATLEFETDMVALKLETEMDVSHKISNQERYSTD
jgi:hypothetical protein